MTIPRLNGIDHVHVYVRNWQDAEAWFGRILGFKRLEKFMSWAVNGGPLTLEDESGTVHLALFEREDTPGHSTIAFNAGGTEFLAWKKHLEDQGLELRIADHRLAWSLYFSDPDNNMHEITSYDHEYIRGELVG